MKKITLLLIICLYNISPANAQFYKSVLSSGAFADSLTIIVKDFKKNFYLIQGDELPSEGLVDIFNSRAGIPGAAHCFIQRYHSEQDTSASWQAIMYSAESYKEAVKIYKNTFHLLKKSKLKWSDKMSVSFEGTMEMPDENVRFTSTPLKLYVPDNEYKNFFAEVEITNSYDGWEVHLNLHNRKKDDERY